MQKSIWFRRLQPIFYFATFLLVWLVVYSYYRDLIHTRRNGYLNAAVGALSVASDQVGAQLDNLQLVVPRATKTPNARFKDYVDYLIPTLDPEDCDPNIVTSLSKSFKGAPASATSEPPSKAQFDRAVLFLRRDSSGLRFKFAVDGSNCAVTTPEFLSAVFRELPDSFEDVLVVSSDGAVQYQSAGIGPRIANVNSLLNAGSQPHTENDLSSLLTGLLPGGGKTAEPASSLESISSLVLEAVRKRNQDAFGFSNVVPVQLAGESYFAVIQPVSSIKARAPLMQSNPANGDAFGPEQALLLVGLISGRTLEAKAAAPPIGTIALAALVLVLLDALFFLISWLWTKTRLHRIRRGALALMAFSAFIFCSGLSLALTHFNFILFHREQESALTMLADKMADNVENELCHLYQVLQGMTGSTEFRKAMGQFLAVNDRSKDQGGTDAPRIWKNLLRQPKTDQTPVGIAYSYPFFDYVFWSDFNGDQIAKWSIRTLTTPKTYMLGYPWFLETRSGRLFELRATTAERRRLIEDASPEPAADHRNARGVNVEPLYSPNTSEFLTILMRKYDYRKPNGDNSSFVGIIVAPLASLNAPVFPAGYGFSVVRRDGSVLFSSNPARNLRENLWRECGLDDRLSSALESGVARTMNLRYAGRDVLMHIRPFDSLDGAGWSIATYRELAGDQQMEVDTLTQSMKLMAPCALTILLLAIGLSLYIRRPLIDFWPDDRRPREYSWLCVILLAIAVFTWCMMGGSRSLVFFELLLLPCIAVFLAICFAFRRGHLAIWLSLCYPLVATVNGIVDARAGLPPRPSIFLGLLAAAICFMTALWSAFTHTSGERPSAPTSKHTLYVYTAMVCMVLLTVAVVPTIGYYHIAHEMVHTLDAMRDLVTTTRAVEERTIAAYRYYSDVSLVAKSAVPARATGGFVANLQQEGRPDVSPETDRFVRDSLARGIHRYDTTLANGLAHVAFPAGQSEALDPGGLPWIDKAALWFSFANLRTPASFVGVASASEHDGDAPLQWFSLRRKDDGGLQVQFDYRGEWLRSKFRPNSRLNVQHWDSFRVASVMPQRGLAGSLWVAALAVAALSFTAYFLLKGLFFVGFIPPDVFPEIEAAALTTASENLIVLRTAGPQGTALSQLSDTDYIDLRLVASENDVATLDLTRALPMLLDHFSLASDSEASARAKLILLERLLSSGKKTMLIAITDPVNELADLVEDSDKPLSFTAFLKETRWRWNQVFLCFAHRRLKLDVDGADPQCLAERIYSSCTKSERALLFQVASDGWVNPKNSRAISSLVARGWLKLAPMPMLTEGFESLGARVPSLVSREEIRDWHANEDSGATWVTIVIAFIILAVLLVAGKDLLQSIPGVLGVLAAAIPAIAGAGSRLWTRAAAPNMKSGAASA